MLKAYGKYWKNYFNFSDRATRGDYWWPVLCQGIIMSILMILITSQVTFDSMGNMGDISGFGMAIFAVYFIFALASIIPGLSVTVRRLHDIGKSGWWYLLTAVPCIGSIVVLVFMCTPGTLGPNKYGQEPG